MKTKQLMLGAVLPLLLPLLIRAQFMTDYLPAGSPSVTSVINGVSVTETFPAANGFSRSVNTIQENGNLNTDVWMHSVTNAGVTVLSLRYGLANTPERAAALVRCPNGDFIIIGTTIFNNQSVWAFRITNAGAIVWSNRYFNPNLRLTSFCIRQTAEAAENYAIAAAADGGAGNRLVIFKINAAGNLVWNFQYQPGAGVFTDTPKCMFIAGANVVVAGNRSTTAGGVVNNDLFAIAVTAAAGAIAIPYRTLGSALPEIDPYINRGNGGAAGDFALTYRLTQTVGAVTTGRIAFLRLTAALNVINPSFYYWENNTTNSYGHTIWPNGAGTGYDIGGGTTTAGGLNNPLFMSVTNAGAGGNYSRKWVTLNFQSTYMHRDGFGFAPLYEHHNFKAVAGQNSMSLMRNPALAAPCNLPAPINQLNIAILQTNIAYGQAAILQQVAYPVPVQVVNGNFVNCNGGGGAFKTTQVAAEPEVIAEAANGFRLYPTLLQGNTPLTVQLQARQAGFATVNIFSLQGQQVLSRKIAVNSGANRLNIESTGLKTGSYMVEVSAGADTWRSKIIRE